MQHLVSDEYNMCDPESLTMTSPTIIPRYFEPYVCEYVAKEPALTNDKYVNRNCIKNSPLPIDNKEFYETLQFTQDDDCQYQENNSTAKKCSILSKFYKADGSPTKGLWDNELTLKEQRTYKYDPKPLERRKNPRSFVPDEKKNNDYWERRKKNNQAARKSREDRRRKEIEILKSVETLKSDNIKLKIFAQKTVAENQSLKYEVEMLKRL